MRARFVALCLAAFAHGSASGADVLAPAAVLTRIQRDGAHATFEAVYRDKASWRTLLSAIATGRAEWLTVANLLHAASDASASEQLTLAVGEALAHQPRHVLSSNASEFGLAAICGGPDVDDTRFNSYDRSIAAIADRQQALRAVADASLLSVRDSCIASLESSKKGIASFFGVAR